MPYLALYFVLSHGFVVMVWTTSPAGGVLPGVLFVIRLAINALTHGPARRKRPTRPDAG